MKTSQLLSVALFTFAGGVLHAATFATDFTYQGRLTDAGQPASGYFEFEYSLWTAPLTGTRLETFGSDIDVTNGLFTIEMEFDPNLINGDNLWLEIKTRRFGVTNYTTLTPRQRLAPTPYAITARKLSGTLPAAQLPASVVTNNQTAVNLSGTFTGNGANVTNVNAASLGGLSAGQFWKTSGNTGTTPGLNYLGTLDNQPLDLYVNGQRGFRLAAVASNSVNVVGGYAGNGVGSGFVGATVSGGGAGNYNGNASPNRASNDFATVVGGAGNTASGIASTAMGDTSTASGAASTAMGLHTTASEQASTAMGFETTAGGFASIAIGYRSTTSGPASTAMGHSTASGDTSTAMGLSTASGSFSTAMGFVSLATGDNSLAAGYNAKALHDGAFVWADATGGNEGFSSVSNNTFNIRARGGVHLDDGSSPTDLYFGANARQMINLFNAQYGIGVQTSTTYLRSNARFSWYKLGVHSDTQNDPGAGGSVLMTLTSSSLVVNGAVITSSDRNRKEAFKPVDARAVLEKVAALPLSEWNYKDDEERTRHVGPMAQDFKAAFNLGTDDKHIATVDADGVALAAIQGLNEKLEAEVKSKDARITELEKRLAAIEALLQK